MPKLPLTLDDEDCYDLFVTLDNVVRLHKGENETVNALREKFLPFYKDWHDIHPFEVHPSAYKREKEMTVKKGDWLQIGGRSSVGFGAGFIEVREADSDGWNTWHWRPLTEEERAEILRHMSEKRG